MRRSASNLRRRATLSCTSASEASPWTARAVVLVALFLVATRPAAAAQREDLAGGFYDPEVVQTVHLEITPEDLDRLQRALPRRIYVPGTFRWKDVTLSPVGIRYKGNSSSAPDSPHKRSFAIAFSEFEKGRRFLGLRQVALANGIQFGSLFSERLITDKVFTGHAAD